MDYISIGSTPCDETCAQVGGDMGWWGIVTNEKDGDDWNKEFEKIKKAFDGYYAVSLDCHI